jgi:DNA-nicking Smr family endonuclease
MTDLPPSPEQSHPDGRASDEPTNESPFSEPVSIPISDVLDLHTISPRDAEAVVEEYLLECYRLKLTAIRVVHGRGIGVQRAMVRKVLERLDFVLSFEDAPAEAGGWGATVVTLRKSPPAKI